MAGIFFFFFIESSFQYIKETKQSNVKDYNDSDKPS
jgi:hypothetical protein